MFHVVLYQPEIPPNTGNIIRLCANAGASLHLIEPLGFELDERRLRRAGLDYREWTTIQVHKTLGAFKDTIAPRQLYAFSTRGRRLYTDAHYGEGDALLFGPETRGLPQSILDHLPEAGRLYLPMAPNNRSVNLSNAVAIAVYEAWRQLKFAS